MKKLIPFVISFFCLSAGAQTIQEQINNKYTPWSLSGFSLISSESDQIHSGGALSTYNFVGPNYRLNQRERVAFKVAYNANTNGYSRFSGECQLEQDAALADPFIEYRNYNLGLLPGIAGVFWRGLAYMPFSKNSRRQRSIGRYRSDTIFNRYITRKLFVEYRNDISFYHQTQNTYRGQGFNQDCQVQDYSGLSNTRRFRLDNWLSAWWIVSRDLSLGGSFVLRDQWYNDSGNQETSRERTGRLHEISAFLGPSLRYTVNFNFNFILSFRDRIDYSGFHPERQDDLVELGEFRSRNTELSLLAFYRF